MTTIWRPASQEIDPLQEAILHAARATILPLAAISSPAPSGEGVRELQLADGRHLRMMLTAQQSSQETRNGRLVVVYGFSGNAVADHAGYRVTGQAILDVATRAFLDVSCRLAPVGAVSV
jgi:hypothetical protein